MTEHLGADGVHPILMGAKQGHRRVGGGRITVGFERVHFLHPYHWTKDEGPVLTSVSQPDGVDRAAGFLPERRLQGSPVGFLPRSRVRERFRQVLKPSDIGSRPKARV